ncbi:MAG: hypothetical protein HUU30_12085 [Burkholderiaceae bacterium]|nr:hypothetical protein [Aquabacterium sp.]NUP86475.1 hypothetical protein [Burkholderiaceae bacterium]
MKDRRLDLVRQELADTALVLEGLSCRLLNMGYKDTAADLRLQAVKAARLCVRLHRGDPDKHLTTGLLALVMDPPDSA